MTNAVIVDAVRSPIGKRNGSLAETHPAGTRPAEWIDVDITGVRRLSILVDFGEDMDLGDQVNCCEARIVK